MYKEAGQYLLDRIPFRPEIGVVLGSGLGEFADSINSSFSIDYRDIPGFPITTVQGHAGRFIIGHCGQKSTIIMQGRFHYYEGHDQDNLALPIRVMKMLGVKTLIITNAAGGINKNLTPGDLMIIRDHINFAGVNPLRGINNDKLGPRFPDMSYAYHPTLRKILMDIGTQNGIHLKEGIYAMMPGPSYETPAEINMLRVLGADAVGMSTVPEVIAAVHGGIRVVGISCITNMAAGILDQPLSHQEVIENAEKAKTKFIELLDAFIMAL